MNMKKTLYRSLMFLAGCVIFGNLMAGEQIIMEWELGYPDPDNPGELKWVEATVPGAVQLDIARAEGYGPYYYAENWRDYLWMEETEFVYRSRFAMPALKGDERLVFTSLGIDYRFEITLNGHSLLQQEGMFTPVRIDLTGRLEKENELLVKISPVPKKHRDPADHTQAASSVKPACELRVGLASPADPFRDLG